MSDDPPHKNGDQDTSVFSRAGRNTYLRVDLDTIYNNINILRRQCSPHTDVIVVIKANAYGHGSVEIARYLQSRGITHFAVATTEEGTQLRNAGVGGYIHVLGNAVEEDISTLLKYCLTPTVSEIDFLQMWYREVTDHAHSNIEQNGIALEYIDNRHQVVLKVDTGMSRNGCQPKELSSLVQYCRDKDLHIHSIMTHFSQAWDNPDFTKQQLSTFMTHAGAYRESGIKLHVSNSSAIINGQGTDLDFIRPGICMYGLPPDSSNETVERVQSLGLRPALSWQAHPTLIKQLPPGRFVGYDNTYKTTTNETIATFSLGYADGYNRLLTGKAVVSLEGSKNNQLYQPWAPFHEALVALRYHGIRCPVVGRVSMDAITVRLDELRPKSTTFHIFTDDFTSPNSITQVAATLNTISYEVATSLAPRLPRVFVSQGKTVAVTKSLISES